MSHISYIGCKISLISKSDIRYEGILYSINPEESTVSLSRVKIFGTENRPTDRPVLGREEIHEFIIFRGQDIKDLRVCEAPKPQPATKAGLPNDPAIVHHSRPSLPVSGHDENGVGSFGAIGSSVTTSPGLHSSVQPDSNRSPDGNLVDDVQPTVVETQRLNRNVDVEPKTRLRSPEQLTFQNRGRGFMRGGSNMGQRQGQMQRTSPRTNSGGYGGGGGNFGGGNRQQFAYKQNRFGNGMRQMDNGRRQGYNNASTGRPTAPDSTMIDPELKVKYKEDYDFETANAGFSEVLKKLKETSLLSSGSNAATRIINIDDETEGGLLPSDKSGVISAAEADSSSSPNDLPQKYYDKEKSFFDSISCEGLTTKKKPNNVQQNRRQGFRNNNNRPVYPAYGSNQLNDRPERRLNRETFGDSGNRNRFANGGNFGGGGGGYSMGNRSGGNYQSRDNRNGRFSREPVPFAQVSM